MRVGTTIVVSLGGCINKVYDYFLGEKSGVSMDLCD